MLNVHRATSPQMFAVGELTAYLRSAVAILLGAAAVFVASRLLAGVLARPLGPWPLLVAGGSLAGLAWIAHAPAQTGRFRAGSVLVSLAMLTIAASLALAGGNSVALLVFWAVIVGEELWAWRGMLPARRSNAPQPSFHLRPEGEGQGVLADLPVAAPHAPVPADGDSIEDGEPTAPAADVLQQLTLRTRAEGGQELSGWLRIPLAAGQRSGSLHVAFCPSFDQAPQIEVEPVYGPDCRIKAAQVLPYGARLDVKLEEPAGEDESVLLWFFAGSGA
jgi:hypothetical protein